MPVAVRVLADVLVIAVAVVNVVLVIIINCYVTLMGRLFINLIDKCLDLFWHVQQGSSAHVPAAEHGRCCG